MQSELSMNEKPTGVTANKKTREFTITWNDNHTSVYPFELLRAACPCASCRVGHENMRSEPDAEVFDIKLGDTPPLGSPMLSRWDPMPSPSFGRMDMIMEFTT